MSDRISQLQDTINQLAETLCNSIGILQQTAQPSALSTSSSTMKMMSTFQKQNLLDARQEEYPAMFSQLIAKAARDVDFLIDHLPPDDANLEHQINMIKKLDAQNKEAATNLLSSVSHGEMLLGKIQRALVDIAECEIEIRKLDI